MDLIVLFFLAREIGRLASRKGLKPGTWRLYTVLAWIITEIIGLLIGFMIFDKDNLFSIGMTGIAFAVTSYFIIKAQLNKFSDYVDDDIDNIGNN